MLCVSLLQLEAMSKKDQTIDMEGTQRAIQYVNCKLFSSRTAKRRRGNVWLVLVAEPYIWMSEMF